MSAKKTIAISGAGLVGSLAAIYLRKRGYDVTVFERRHDMRKSGAEGGRSINLALSNRGIRALEEVGLADELKKVAIPMHGRMMHDRQGKLSSFAYGKEGQFINSVSRSGLNIVLMNEAERLGVQFWFDQRIQKVDFVKTQLFVEGKSGEPFDLIIGADGAFSAVRGSFQFTDRFDYEQNYIHHGYKELHIPPGANGSFQFEKNYLHIWPRESFMMIALPNPDGSFTCTLFFPFDGNPSFDMLKTNADVEKFFEETFPDARKLMPTLLEDFNTNPTSSLVTIKCYPWVRNNTLLIGDAAHGIVPFYGQGMNAGFEDCRILNDLLSQHNDNWTTVLPEFQQLRKPDADAIAQLALDNFIEMRDLVADADFLLRKKIEGKLYELFPDKWIPLYPMVTFMDNMRYSDALRTGQKQKRIMDEVMKTPNLEHSWQQLNFQAIVNQLTAAS
ncbi:MAG TPA: NAD(P)/FAD-dependent oxidoreductase [Cyclobacteriaceae bacterium]|nr:FAD-dependent monooxygenase [Cyclobacteriaceae bacterium]HMV10111.1 NAD(P)/FAD-dependent oxidoreductase [Cyclobacteriaceae bacterium]HMV88664.1 NAD(P)/FAD-dependent oxidoreductase [Cyclobacteriaceae bacterium]HMX00574.1 NAD(P)/FAD-dependent oxidoreductase [Cyclobacteriaceae bacterium]HMX49551.1 NAD(P)/FAD-dependent oxidoreductase [Cyclobacteriaceae bacterium]